MVRWIFGKYYPEASIVGRDYRWMGGDRSNVLIVKMRGFDNWRVVGASIQKEGEALSDNYI